MIAQKQDDRKKAFIKLKDTYKLTPESQSIIQTSPEELVDKLQLKVLSATQVLEAFIAKALEVTEKCNCVTEFVPQALVSKY